MPIRPARSCGILLHPTSLPGPFGIGDLGNEAIAFLDFLRDSRHGWWQMLPLGPVGAGFSPYQSPSSFAGNSLLISPELLREAGWLSKADLRAAPRFTTSRVVPQAAADFKLQLLHRAFENFRSGAEQPDFLSFQQREADWLADFSLFEAIREEHPNRSWSKWPAPLVQRDARALAQTRERLATRIAYHAFVQYVFHLQWQALRDQAIARGIRLIGDVPIFVAFESADVWANPELFLLDANHMPRAVAGVPPDYFNSEGQLWGNPVYDWPVHRERSFSWWVRRIARQLKGVDLIRLDHFRGFESYWEIPARARTARKGRWMKGPGSDFFSSLREQLGRLPFIAEDLGEITPEVNALRERFDLPGMKVLQFAFGGLDSGNPYLPHNLEPHCVVYTGTHDNDTTRGWFDAALKRDTDRAKRVQGEARFALDYLGATESRAVDAVIRAAYMSVADLVIIPMQDHLRLGSEARMNVPGTANGNWVWRMERNRLTGKLRRELATLADRYGRAASGAPI